MATNPYLDSGPCFIAGGFQDSSNPSEPEPQYVHCVAPSPAPPPPPEMTDSIPDRKGVRQRCVKRSVVTVVCLLFLLLVAGVLLGYYLSSPCIHGVGCGDGSCVWESQWCDGVKDCPRGQDESSCLRLHGSSFLLQLYSPQSKSWRSVCSHGWTEQQGRASCQLMGYSRSTYFKSAHQKSDADSGFFTVKRGWNPEAPVLTQLVHRDACPNKSVVTLRCIDCGRNGRSSSRIAGGRPAAGGSWPWQVSLRVEGAHRCGGSIIAPYWIVTAAHCVAGNSDPGDWAVYAGILGPTGTLFSPVLPVSRIVEHQAYSSRSLSNDIALMKLSKPLDLTAASDVRPVCLPNVGLNVSADQKCWISGFGSTVYEGSGSLHLMEAEVSLIDSSICNGSALHDGRITPDMICAAGMEGGADACQGDGGSPLVSQQDGVWWLIGDASWGDRGAGRNRPCVYGNVSYFLSWIYHQMQKYQD